MKWIGQHIWDLAAKFRNTVDFSEDVTFYQPVNDANPGISIGASDDERLSIFVDYQGSTTQLAQIVAFHTFTESGTAQDGRFHFAVDEVNILKIQDGGIDFFAGKGIGINGVDILTDNGSGAATLSNIDALDATTIATFETAMEANLDTFGSQMTSASSLATIGTITTGVWQGTDVGVAHGGTGASTLGIGQVLVGNGTGSIVSTHLKFGNDAGETDTSTLSILSNQDLGDKFTIGTTTHGATTLTTVDDDATAAHFEIAADGDITLDSAGQIKLEPVAGNNILLDGTIAIDAGVVTGATSITSTSFVGALTGQADTVATIAGLAPNTATTQASQPNITGVGTIGTGVWNGTAIASAYLDADTAHLTTAQTFTGSKTMGTDVKLNFRDANSYINSPTANDLEVVATDITLDAAGGIRLEASDVTMYDPVDGGNPSFSIGANGSDSFFTTAVYNSGAQTLDSVVFQSKTTSSTTNDGRFQWYVDDVFLMNVGDSGFSVYGVISALADGARLTAADTTASSATQGGILRLQSDDGDVMGDNHRLGVIEFKGAEDDGNTVSIGARIQAICRDAWDGSNNDADLEFYTTDGTTESKVLTLDADKLATFTGAVTVTGALTGTLATANQSNVTGLGTIATGVWNGTAIAHAYIDADAIETDNIADAQVTVAKLHADAVQTSGESFADNDTSLMTSAAIDDAIIKGGSTTVIKVLPYNFMSNEDGGANKSVQFRDDTIIGVRATANDSELYAFVEIPIGKTATAVIVYGNDSGNVVEVFESDINAGALTDKTHASGCVVGTACDITDVAADATNYLVIKVTITSYTNDIVYGAAVTISG